MTTRYVKLQAGPAGITKKVPAIKGVRFITGYSLKEAKEVIDELVESRSAVTQIPVRFEERYAEGRAWLIESGALVLDKVQCSAYYDEVRRLTKRAIDSGDLAEARILLCALEDLA